MQSMFQQTLQERLQQQKANNLYRTRRLLTSPQAVVVNCNGKSCISFCSNDYLGLANHPAVIIALQAGAEKYGVGSGASQLISGHSSAHRQLEEAFADYMQCERALLFSSGYMANLGVINALVSNNTSIFMDKYNHASLIDAVRLSHAPFYRYVHGNLEHLTSLLHKNTDQNKLIVTDSVFSMQGDVAPLVELAALTKKNAGWLVVDDAHGFGVLGASGRGAREHFNLTSQDVQVLICPLGKAMGCAGALVAGSELLIESLIQFARTYIYTTAIPPALACAALASLTLVQRETWRHEKLTHLIAYFQQGAAERNLVTKSTLSATQIFPVVDEKTAVVLSAKLYELGYLVAAMRPPTVPKHQCCLRITLSCVHEEEQIDKFLDQLGACYAKYSTKET